MSAVSKTVTPKKATPTRTPRKKAATARKAPAPKKAAPKKAVTRKAATKAVKPVAKEIKVKQKLVRDGFTMPASDFALIDVLKERLLTARRPTKKSELLRAGLHALAALPADKLLATVESLLPLKTGRPKKDA